MLQVKKRLCGAVRKYLTTGVLLVPALLICFPVFLILTGSVMDGLEMKQYLIPVFRLPFLCPKSVCPLFREAHKLLGCISHFH